jgi:hypothetical protein
MEVGSGTTPVTLLPAVVPNEKTALSTLEAEVTPGALIVNEADPFRNGLCGPFPAIDPPAAL